MFRRFAKLAQLATRRWRGGPMRGLHAIGLAMLLLPLGLTFVAWKSLVESSYRQNQAQFEALAREGEQAMNARLAAYASAARSGAGIVQSSEFVSRDEWRTFIEALRLSEDYPGMLGLGWIDRDVITYLEPDRVTGLGVGMDIVRQPAIRAAAARAADTGMATLSAPVMLGDDDDPAAGFLLMQPVYRVDLPLDEPAQRRAALRGFVFTPFQARGLFSDLTPSQGRRLDVTLQLGAAASAHTVFTTREGRDEPQFRVRRPVDGYGAQWSIEWRSTLEFERSGNSGGAHFVLFGGLLFTGLFAVLLVVFGARRPKVDSIGPLEQPWLLPLVTFALVSGGSFAAYALLGNAEDDQIRSRVEIEARRLEADLDRTSRERLQVLRRVAHRWSSGGGTPYVVWRNDARDLTRQIGGLDQLQWIGPDYHVHWSEGTRRGGWVESADARAQADHRQRLAVSAEQGITYVTQPREIARGEWSFLAFAPVSREGRFDGFISGTFSTRGFFGGAAEGAAGKSFAFVAKYDDRAIFTDGETPAVSAEWQRAGNFKLNDRRWSFTVSPTQRFVDEHQTSLPWIVLVAGLLIACLSGFLVRYVLSSRLEAARFEHSAQALAASEERYELAMRGMSVGLWDWNVCTNAVFLSQRSKDLMGATAPGFVPAFTGFLGRLHPEDRSRVEKALNGHLKRQSPFDVEFRLRRDQGDYIWVHIYGQAQFDEQGFAMRMAGSIQDITAKRQQEEQLQRSEAQLRLLVENTPAAVAMFDKDMRYLMTSRRWIQDYALEGRDIIGMSHYDVFPEIREMPRWIDVHQRALRGERFDRCEDSWTRADGQQEWNQWAIHPWMDADGKVGGIVMFTEVITARKRAEAALRTTEAMNRAAMDKAPIGKALVTSDGRFAKVNPALCQMLGYSEAEMLARDFQGITHPDDLAADLEHLRALLDGRTVSYQMEKRYFHRDGRVIWVQLTVSVVRHADGSVEFLVAHILDISDRKNVEHMKDEFISMVSNELRTPLTSIRDSLGTIAGARNPPLPDSLQRVFDACRANCDRVGSLVEEILELEKLAAGQLRFDFKDESIAEITRQAVSVSEAYGRIVLRPIDEEWMVYVDSARYARVLSNLLSNAAKFSADDTPIEVGVELRDEWIRIHVRDRGVGIPEDFRARIFGKFAHVDAASGAGSGHQKGGAGLGLYLSRQMVEQMRGTIGFICHPGAGTTFWVEFPRVSRGARRLSA